MWVLRVLLHAFSREIDPYVLLLFFRLRVFWEGALKFGRAQELRESRTEFTKFTQSSHKVQQPH